MTSNEARIWVFDVEYGICVFVRAPNGRTLLIDCGKKNRFSPARYISRFELPPDERVDQLIVTHPHAEHLLDIENVATLLRPRSLLRQIYDWPELEDDSPAKNRLQPPPWREALQAYVDWQSAYPEAAETVDWGAMTVQTFSVPVDAARGLGVRWVNNSSILVVVTIGGFTIVVPGDLEAEGWEQLLAQPELRAAIGGATVYLTAYHSHPEGNLPAIYEAMGLPALNLSVVHRKNILMSRDYAKPERATGVEVDGKMRYEFTNWRDGSVLLRVTEDGSWRFALQRLLPTESWPDATLWGQMSEPTQR